MLSEAEVVAQIVIETFEALGIEYFIGGSVASTVHGIPRMTMDVDIIADIHVALIEPFVARLEADFYIDVDMIREAIRHSSSFNIIHLPTMVKADIFTRKQSLWGDSEWSRRQRRRIGPSEQSPEVNVASAEDMILQKLEWYRLTGERSDKQWGDVQGMLKTQADFLDYNYLKYWAEELQLTTLLQTALSDAGL